MKRSLLIFTLAALVFAAAYPQTAKKAPGATSPMKGNTEETAAFPVKAGGDIIWQCTFDWANPSDPRGWTLPDGWEIRDNADLGNLWIWLQDSIKGRWTNERAPSWFTSRSDGFIAVPMDAYNYRDGIDTEHASDTYIMTPPINCSNAPSVVVKLSQYYRFCCENDNTGHLQLMVTNDNGGHWATYDLSYGIGHNTFTPSKYRVPEINISDVAAGMANVRIKIYFHEVPYYFWAIDDLTLSEAYTNDLVLEDSWSMINFGFDEPIGHTNFVPFTQIGMEGAAGGTVGDCEFRGALLNSGTADAEDARLDIHIQKNGEEVFTGTSDASTIWTLERDTLEGTAKFHPGDYGDYRFQLTATAANGEDKEINNSATYLFTVNDTLFQRADMTPESGTYTGVWANGNTAGDFLAVRYDIQAPCEVNSVSAYVWSFTPAINPSFQFVILKYIPEDDVYMELITSDVVTMDSTRLRWVTLPLVKDGESEFLQPGEYYAAWRAWAEDGRVGMRLGWDMNDRAEFTGYSLIWLGSIATWYASDKLPILGMNLNSQGGPRQAAVAFNVDMSRHIASGEFKPGTDFVDVSGSFNNWTGSAHLTDPEADGIYSISIPGMPIGSTIQYKYRINGNWDTSEYPMGGPNRKYTVRYWNVLNDLYNSGNTTGVPSESLVTSFRVYPNPSQGAFTLEMERSQPADLTVTLTDIRGKVLYGKTIKGALSIRETLDQNVASGMYFLTVNDGRETRVEKVMIR